MSNQMLFNEQLLTADTHTRLVIMDMVNWAYYEGLKKVEVPKPKKG